MNTGGYIPQIQSNKTSIILSSAILIAFFLYNLYSNMLFFGIGIFLMVFCALFMKTPNAILIYMALAPNLMMIKLQDNSSALFGYLLLIIEIKYLLTRYLRLNFSLILFVSSGFLTVLTNMDMGLISSLVRTVLFFWFISLFLEEYANNKTYKDKLIRQYIFGIVMCIVLGIMYWTALSKNIYVGYFSGIRNDRNYFSSVVASGIAIAVIYLYYATEKKLFIYISIAIMLFAGIISASRTFLLSMIFVILMILLFPEVSKKMKLILGIVVLALFALIVFSDVLIPAFENVLLRFTEDDFEGGNGRFENWGRYLSKSFSSIHSALFGNGDTIKFITSGEFEYVEHNSIVQSIFNIGVFGTANYVYQFLRCNRILNCEQINPSRICSYFPLLTVIFCYCAISGAFSDNFNIAVIMSMIVASYCRQLE